MTKFRSVMAKHNEKYESSGLSIRKYCESAGINSKSLQGYRYWNKKRRESSKTKSEPSKEMFQEYDVGVSFKISFGDDGLISLHGICPENIAGVLKACHALSE